MPPNQTVEIHRDPEASLAEIEGTLFATEERFAATITPDDPRRPTRDLALVVEDGRVVCDALLLRRRPGGPALTTSHVREVRVPQDVRAAADAAAHLVLAGGKGPASLTWGDGKTHRIHGQKQFDDEHVAVPISGATRTPEWQAIERRRGGRLTDQTLEEVARIYREAQLKARGPTNAVRDEMHVSRSTAGRWVARAREAGFLRPAPRRGMAGEKS